MHDLVVSTTRVDDWIANLELSEKCRLLGGASSWRTHPVDRLGIPAVKMSDGPNGVRGDGQGADRVPGVAVPVGISQGATWDPDLVARIGDLLGREAVRKGAHVLLAPAVNLHRTPIGGRTFEYYAEDPELTAHLAVATVRAVQAHGVAVAVKHFVANDTEVQRHTVDVRVDERPLRELYLRPFEAAVTEGGAWGVMSAYNKVAGEFCAANARLLRDILRGEWGFDGFVVSDWFGAHDAASSAHGGLNIEMPGPARVYGEHLERAVTNGDVDEVTVDGLVRGLLMLIERTRAVELSSDRTEQSIDDPADRALCREAAVAGTVLLRNQAATLPLNDGPRTIAVLGPNALGTRTMGGGSSSLLPMAQRSILDALIDRVDATILHEPGVRIDRRTPLPHGHELVGTDGAPGLELTFTDGGIDDDARVSHRSRTMTTLMRCFGSVPTGVDPQRSTIRLRGSFVPDVDGEFEIGAILMGSARVRVGGSQVIDDRHRRLPRGDAFYGMGSIEVISHVAARAGQPLPIEIDVELLGGFGGFRLGISEPDPPDLFERAVEAARSADAAVVVVGTTDEWETEGEDRDTIKLPGAQDELIERVAAVNKRTVVVVNAGAPVAMPWSDAVGAILVPFFGGMEMGDALVDVLLGEADPGGRLPITFPRRLEDTPAWPYYAPIDGVQRYGEGLLMGYRGFDNSGVEPLFPFGHGLSYGTVEWGDATASALKIAAGGAVTVEVPLRNIGDRLCSVVVQGYVAPLDPPVARAPKELKIWAKLHLERGTSANATLRFGPQAFRRWDDWKHRWTVDRGRYDLVLAASAKDERQRITVEVID